MLKPNIPTVPSLQMSGNQGANTFKTNSPGYQPHCAQARQYCKWEFLDLQFAFHFMQTFRFRKAQSKYWL